MRILLILALLLSLSSCGQFPTGIPIELSGVKNNTKSYIGLFAQKITNNSYIYFYYINEDGNIYYTYWYKGENTSIPKNLTLSTFNLWGKYSIKDNKITIKDDNGYSESYYIDYSYGVFSFYWDGLNEAPDNYYRVDERNFNITLPNPNQNND